MFDERRAESELYKLCDPFSVLYDKINLYMNTEMKKSLAGLLLMRNSKEKWDCNV